MRLTRRIWISLFAGLVGVAALPSFAMHSGGVGSCKECHTTHDDAISQGAPGIPLLRGGNATDTCLRCHATTSGNTWGNSLLVPGPTYGAGPFIFLEEDNIGDGAADGVVRGNQAGHNVVSIERGTSSDPDFTTAPGGTYPSDKLQCTSCHDPHGKGGHFRLLYGSDTPPSQAGGYSFTYNAPAPTAVGVDVDGSPESKTNHTAYVSGMTRWCGSCHGNSYHSEGGTSAFHHPVDEQLESEIVNNYNQYRGTGFMDGTGLDAYEPLVPVEDPNATINWTGPVTTQSRVTCISCHRAHASSGPHSGRWDFHITTWAEEGIKSGSYPIPNPYQLTAGPAQQRLCHKCHGSSIPD